jgi:hypothetical protein
MLTRTMSLNTKYHGGSRSPPCDLHSLHTACPECVWTSPPQKCMSVRVSRSQAAAAGRSMTKEDGLVLQPSAPRNIPEVLGPRH